MPGGALSTPLRSRAACLGRRRGNLLEHLGVAPGDARHVAQQGCREGIRIGVAHEHCERRELLGPAREGVGLAVRDHLQAMLDPAQEAVGDQQLGGRAGAEPSGARQAAERPRRGRVAEPGITPAPDELQGLRQELDLADAALAELDVMAEQAGGGRPLRAERRALVRVHAALHGVDVGQRGEVEAATPDEGTDGFEELRAEQGVAGHRARLDHGGALPVLAHALVVGDGGGERDGGRGRCRVGAEAKIDAEHVAVRVARLHERHEVAGEAGEGGAQPFRVIGMGVGVVQEHEVNIAGVIQLAGAELAHAEDGEAAAARRVRGIGQPEVAAVVRGAEKVPGRETECLLGERGERRRDRAEAPRARDVGHRDRERDLALRPAHGSGDRRPRRGERRGGEGGEARRHDRVGTVIERAAQRSGFAKGEVAQIRAVAAECAEQGGHVRPGREVGPLGTEGGEAFAQALGGGGIGGLGEHRNQGSRRKPEDVKAGRVMARCGG